MPGNQKLIYHDYIKISLYKDIFISLIYSFTINLRAMSVLTLRATETDDLLIEELKKKYDIPVATKALLFAAQKCLALEKEVAELKQERQQLRQKVSDYRAASLDILSGLSQITKLTS
jgi:hypothetical protein